MYDYDPLWKTMKEKGMTQYILIKKYEFSRGTLDNLRKNRSVTMNTIDVLCQILRCEVDEVVRITFDEAVEESS